MSTTRRPCAGPRTLAITRLLLVATAVIALITAPAYRINGLTRSGADVQVAVRYVDTGETSTPAGLDATFDTVQPSLPSDLTHREGSARPSVFLTVENDDLDLSVWDSTTPEWMLARGDDLVRGLAVGVGALLLWRVVTAVGRGQAFARGDAACIAGVAGTVALAGYVAPLLALAEAFRRGERLTRETDGLV